MRKTLFSANDGTHGTELWISDGTAQGTSLLADLFPGAIASVPTGFAQVGSKVVFSANHVSLGKELWITDGTAAGTSLLKDIKTLGSGSSSPTSLTSIGNKVVFIADDQVSGFEPWVTDGTEAGTYRLVDIAPGISPSDPKSLVKFGNSVLFWATDNTTGHELWITDGTSAGTSLVKDINIGSDGSNKYGVPGVFNNRAFFQARTGGNSNNYELWSTNGTTAGTTLTKEITAGTNGSYPKYVTPVGTKAVFTAFTSAAGFELWVTDGTAAGTSLLKDIRAGAAGSSPNQFIPLGSRLVFAADNGSAGREIWSTDGTAAGTTLLKDVNAGTTGSLPLKLTAFGSQVLFAATDATAGYELWATDGTPAGTIRLADINPGTAGATPISIVNAGSIALVSANDGTHGGELWVTDGTPAGTSLLADINQGVTGSAPANFFSSADFVACFRQGTGIRTDRGDIPVEQLREGDRVVSAFGGAVPIRWLGHRHVDIARHPRPWDVTPIRVAPHAFGPNQPARPLFLSPDHAVHLAGVLVPIRHLVNGRTIRPEPADAITYWHVELPAHDVLLAEGLPCESYLDTGNRAAFANAPGPTALHPDFRPARAIWAEQACAPLVDSGPALAPLRETLLAIAETLGHTLTQDPALTLLANNRPLTPTITGTRWHLRLPPGTTSLRLHSRTWVPAETRPAEHDTRPLGVALANLTLDGTPIPLDDPRLATGWATPEPAWRWTIGDATLIAAGARDIAFDLALTGTYWRDDQARRAASGE